MARTIRPNGPIRQAPERSVLAPEVVDPRGPAPWEVIQGGGLQGGTNLQGRRMHAPGADSPQAHAVRLHELLHARITPPDLMAQCQADGRSWDASQACEDGRLNETARQYGIGAVLAGAITEEQAVAMISASLEMADRLESAGSLPGGGPTGAQLALHRAACIAVALWRTEQWSAVWTALRGHGRHRSGPLCNAITSAVGEVRDGARDPAATIRAARHLDALLTPQKAQGRNNGGEDDFSDGATPPPTTEEAGDLDSAADAVEVLRPPLHRSSRHLARVRRRTTDAGRLTRPTETLRPEGGRPFTRKRRAEGAVILLDSSGSMGYSHETLAQIVEACPGALVAIHASDGENRARVAIVAEGGRCITPEALSEVRDRVGGGNANDAGCLRAVARIADRARIPGPRWWVTDEGFGDLHGSIGHSNVRGYCRDAARWNGFGIAAHERDVFS